jgi:hypothetical protein
MDFCCWVAGIGVKKIKWLRNARPTVTPLPVPMAERSRLLALLASFVRLLFFTSIFSSEGCSYNTNMILVFFESEFCG